MPKIHIFISVDEAISVLKNYDKQIEKQDLSKEDIIKESVSSNIFRAFHHLLKGPSIIYRTWAQNNFDEILKSLNIIQTEEKYNQKLFEWIYSFIDYWDSQINCSSERIIFGPASKMVNLLIKMINESNLLRNPEIIKFMNVPFDKYTLKPLIDIINNLTDIKYKVDIPKNPTMKFINSPNLYLIIQKAIFKLCNKANIYPIIFDYWCWNEKH